MKPTNRTSVHLLLLTVDQFEDATRTARQSYRYNDITDAQPLVAPDSSYQPYRQAEGCEPCPGDEGLTAEDLSGPCPWA